MGHRNMKPPETSKLLAYWAVAVASASLIASYALAAFGLDSVSDLTVAVFSACIGYLVTYAGKSLGEKISRNRHGLDADGLPYQIQTDPLDIEEDTYEN